MSENIRDDRRAHSIFQPRCFGVLVRFNRVGLSPTARSPFGVKIDSRDVTRSAARCFTKINCRRLKSAKRRSNQSNVIIRVGFSFYALLQTDPSFATERSGGVARGEGEASPGRQGGAPNSGFGLVK